MSPADAAPRSRSQQRVAKSRTHTRASVQYLIGKLKRPVDTNDKFKKLNVRRSTPQNGRAGNGLGDNNQWAYDSTAAGFG